MKRLFKRLQIAIMILIFVLLGLAVIYISYLKINDEPNIKQTGSLSVNYENGNKIKVVKKRTVKFSVINTSNVDAYYYIEFKDTKNVKGNVKYSLKGGNLDISDNLNSFNTTIAHNVKIEAGKTEEYELTLKADKNIIYSLEININEENADMNTFADTILKHNKAKDKPVTNIGIEAAKTDEGLIKTEDDDGVSYYFRGSVNNNYVSIEDLLFRIVRINGDGSVKLVLDGESTSKKVYYDGDKYDFNSSPINNYLNKEWLNYSIGKSEYHIASQRYCNDIAKDDSGYLSYTRIIKDNIPSLICVGNKVSLKVGLLTVDEVLYAGASLNEQNIDFYLHTDQVTENSFLMTPAIESNGVFYPFSLSANGQVITNHAGINPSALRPVITIIKTATATGEGTLANPYKLSSK